MAQSLSVGSGAPSRTTLTAILFGESSGTRWNYNTRLFFRSWIINAVLAISQRSTDKLSTLLSKISRSSAFRSLFPSLQWQPIHNEI